MGVVFQWGALLLLSGAGGAALRWLNPPAPQPVGQLDWALL